MAYVSKKKLIDQILKFEMSAPQHVHEHALGIWLDLDLTIAQLKSLFFINYEGVTNSKSLATALGVTPPNVTGIIDRLVEHDLVSRDYNQLNRRELLLQLTPKGKELLNNLKEERISRHANLLNQMEAADLAALAKGLAALVKAAQQDEGLTTRKHVKKELAQTV
jgi:MarR family transcriptional regulator, organic hydroperoxide resistance regulator